MAGEKAERPWERGEKTESTLDQRKRGRNRGGGGARGERKQNKTARFFPSKLTAHLLYNRTLVMLKESYIHI